MSSAAGGRQRERSQSPGGWRPLRPDAPERRPRQHGLARWPECRADRAAAWKDFEENTYAASSRAPLRAKLRSIEAALAAWGADPLPPTAVKIRMLGASLRYGAYRAASSYLSAYKLAAQRLGYDFTPDMLVALADAGRSCNRGLGAPTKAKPLPLELLWTLPGAREAWAPSGPL